MPAQSPDLIKRIQTLESRLRALRLKEAPPAVAGGGPSGIAYYAINGNKAIGIWAGLPWEPYTSLPGDTNSNILEFLTDWNGVGEHAFATITAGYYIFDYQIVANPNAAVDLVTAEVGLARPIPPYLEDDRIEQGSGAGYASLHTSFVRYCNVNTILSPYVRSSGTGSTVIGFSGGNNFGGSHFQATKLS